jgi:hypothetical protein
MTNVKTGDLAILIKDERPENIGAIVEVGKRDYDWRLPGPGPYWHCTTTGRPLVTLCLVDLQYRMCTEVLCPDDYLRPISGIPDGDVTARPKEIYHA